MSDTPKCPQCGVALPTEPGEGLCPRCLLRIALQTNLDVEESPIGGASALVPGERFGPYKTVRLLGEGGMGVVCLAEQQQPIRRNVALKVIKRGLDTLSVIRRFEAERQALAMMDHPNIARVFDAGATGDGRPYFVMEYVPGIPLTRYCDRHRLNARERLELLIPVCEAIQHAHHKGVIHRDIKPSNVLVSVHDDKPTPKVIDFGVAKATSRDVTELTSFTELGLLIGTPEYMSPEQIAGESVDATTDIYSLGTLLYELLVGVLPFDPKVLRRAGYDEIRRIICEGETPRPTARLRGLGVQAAEIALRRRTDSATLEKQLRGDLDWITLKAMEKKRTRRYASVSELAADVRRHLDDLPVVAASPSTSYRVAKFVRRHKLVVLTGFMVACSLMVGLALAAWQATEAHAQRARADAKAYEADRQARRAEDQRQRAEEQKELAVRERDRAEAAERAAMNERDRALSAQQTAISEKQRANTETATTNAVDQFLQNLLAQAGADAQARPDTKPDPDLKVRTVLDRAAARVEGMFKAQPLVEAAIQQTIGNAYKALGIYADAQRHLERAVDLRKRILGEDNLSTLSTLSAMYDLADNLYRMQGSSAAQAEPLLVHVLEVRRRVLGNEHPLTIEAMYKLAALYRVEVKHAQALPLFTEALELGRRVLGEDHPITLETMSKLALLYRSQNRLVEAEPLLTEALDGLRRVFGDEHPETLVVMDNLASVYRWQGKYAQAESLFNKVLDHRKRILGEAHPDTRMTELELAAMYFGQNRFSEAESVFTHMLEVERRALGEENPETLQTVTSLASLFLGEGRLADAEPLFTRVLEARQRVLGQEHIQTLLSMEDLAHVRQEQGRYTEAESLLTHAREITRRTNNEKLALGVMERLAELYWWQRRYGEADSLATEVLEGIRRLLPQSSQFERYTVSLLGAIRLEQQRYAEAEVTLREALTDFEMTMTSADFSRRDSPLGPPMSAYYTKSMLGASLAGQKKYAEAEPLLLSGYESLVQRNDCSQAARRFSVEQAGQWIVQLYRNWGKTEKVTEWQDKLRAAKSSERPNRIESVPEGVDR